MIKKRLEYFKRYFEQKNPRWKVFYTEELPENIAHKTIYFVITGEEIIRKQKSINFSIFYISTREKDGLLNFREDVKNFIKNYLSKEFETPNFYCNSGYRIDYSIDDERGTLRIAEIQCTYDCTKQTLDEETFNEKILLMQKLKNEYILNE